MRPAVGSESSGHSSHAPSPWDATVPQSGPPPAIAGPDPTAATAAYRVDDPDRVASQRMFSTAFHVHPYGVPVIGHREVFDRLTIEDARA